MKGNLITEDLIIQFFEGKCNARDAAIVQAWINENPAKLKEYIGVEEWESFQPAHTLSPDISGKLWNNIHKNAPSPAVHHSYFRWMAAAASVLLAIGLSWLFIFKNQKASIAGDTSVAAIKNISNNTAQKMVITLSDSSTVELSPNSAISYPESFNAVKRDVMLNGEATFNIAKNAAKPFSVYSNTVLIKVLGTRFTVTSYEANNVTKVILHEGGIMVKTADSSFSGSKNEFYLTPGDIFVFKKENKRSPIINAAPAATTKDILNDSLSVHVLHLEKDKDSGYVFNNYPLDVVFDQLQIIYNTKVIYNKAGLGNRTFIGKIDKKDSLSHILKSIVLLNNFDLQKQGDSFIIK